MSEHAGALIQQYCYTNRISIEWLARELRMTRVGLYKALKSKYITVDRVLSISQILHHNFFDDYFPASVTPGTNSVKVSAEIAQLRAENKKLETELNSLREIISIFKSRTESP